MGDELKESCHLPQSVTWGPALLLMLFQCLGFPTSLRKMSLRGTSICHQLMGLRRTEADVNMPVLWAGWVKGLWWFLKTLVIHSWATVKCHHHSKKEKKVWPATSAICKGFFCNYREREKNLNLLVYRLTISCGSITWRTDSYSEDVDQVQGNLNKDTRRAVLLTA